MVKVGGFDMMEDNMKESSEMGALTVKGIMFGRKDTDIRENGRMD